MRILPFNHRDSKGNVKNKITAETLRRKGKCKNNITAKAQRRKDRKEKTKGSKSTRLRSLDRPAFFGGIAALEYQFCVNRRDLRETEILKKQTAS